MREDIKDTLFLFGIAILLWILSSAITNPLFVWLLMWGLKIGAVLFVLGGIVAIINTSVNYRSRKKNNDNNNP
jgi:membrane protein implicated in regulation of membrane protease activity